MNKKLVSLLIAGTAFVAGCDQANTPANDATAPAATPATTPVASAPAAPVVDKANAVAVVNGIYISKTALDDLQKEVSVRVQGKTIPKEKLLEELIQRQLLVQDALQKQLDKSPDVLSQLENIKNTLLTQAALQSFIKANPVSDAELKAEYDSKVGGSNDVEYKASHILVKTEEEAKKIITELDKGGKFADLANKYSLDAKETQNGGDLGWFSAGEMIEPFSEAVTKLEKGKYSKEPVKTKYGYHIILREDSRQQTPPPFDAVKEQLKPFLERKKVQAMVEAMRKQAKVEVLIPLDDKKATATPAPVAEEKAPAPEQPAATTAVEEAGAVKSAPAPAVEEAGAVKSAPEQPATTEKAPTPAPAVEGAKVAEPAKTESPAPSDKK
jgi:peptidyl-prolyl cis-trans isomerase C